MITRSAATALAVAAEPIPAHQVVDGQPTAGVLELPAPPGLEVGVWEHSEGTSTDVEVDEVFVVLAGRATIEVDGGSVLEVGPGDVGILPPGARTRWRVHEDLRKVYVIRSA